MGGVFVSVPLTVKAVIEAIIKAEGGFIDHPSDPGGATNMGITIPALSKFRNQVVLKSDIMGLSTSEAIQIYYQDYWCRLNIDMITSWWLKEFIFDWCVTAGLKNPIRTLQRLVGAKPDGMFGYQTYTLLLNFIKANGKTGPGLIVDARIQWYLRLAESNHKLSIFTEGWFNRANKYRYLTIPYITE